MAALVVPSSYTAVSPQQSRAQTLKEALCHMSSQSDNITGEALPSLAELAEELFYSNSDSERELAYRFFVAMFSSGGEREFSAIAPFFAQGHDPHRNTKVLTFFNYYRLIEELIFHIDRVPSARRVVTQALSKGCETEEALTRTLALKAFGHLLARSKMSSEEKQVVEAATEAASRVFDRPCPSQTRASEREFYENAVMLFGALIENHIHHNAEKILYIVTELASKEASYLREAGEQLLQRINGKLARARALLPSDATTQTLSVLAQERPDSIVESEYLFWGLFCRGSRFTAYSPLRDIEMAKAQVEQLRPFFQKGDDFFTLSLEQEGFLIDAAIPQPVDLTRLSGGRYSLTFDRDVKPFVCQLAQALQYQCTIDEAQLRVLVPRRGVFMDVSTYACVEKRATRFQLQPRKAIAPAPSSPPVPA